MTSTKASGASKASTADIFLVDDHPSVRRALREVIKDMGETAPCGESASSDKALRQIEKTSPEVAVVDLSLEDGHGLGLIENLGTRAPETKAIVYSMYEEEVYAERSVRAGAAGYLHKSEPPEKIQEAIRTVLRGEVYLSRHLRMKLLNKLVEAGSERKTQSGTGPREASSGAPQSGPRRPTKKLTDRELMVFQMIGLGYSIGEIKGRLSLSRKTVETYRRRAKEKLGCESIKGLYKTAVQWTNGRGTHCPAGLG